MLHSNVNFFSTFPLGLTFYLPGTTTALRTGCAKKENIEDCSGFELLADLKGRMRGEKQNNSGNWTVQSWLVEMCILWAKINRGLWNTVKCWIWTVMPQYIQINHHKPRGGCSDKLLFCVIWAEVGCQTNPSSSPKAAGPVGKVGNLTGLGGCSEGQRGSLCARTFWARQYLVWKAAGLQLLNKALRAVPVAAWGQQALPYAAWDWAVMLT